MIDVYEHDVKNKVSASDFKVRHLSTEEILHELKNKLAEEMQEVRAAYDEEDKTHLKEELGDLIEVIDAILYHNDISLEEVLALRGAKKEKRGGFEKGLYLEYIDYFDNK